MKHGDEVSVARFACWIVVVTLAVGTLLAIALEWRYPELRDAPTRELREP